MADQNQEDVSGVQAESGAVRRRLRVRVRLRGQRRRGERGFGKHAPAAIPGLYQRPFLRHHVRLAIPARSGVVGLRRAQRHHRQRRGGHRGNGRRTAATGASRQHGGRRLNASQSQLGLLIEIPIHFTITYNISFGV